MRGGEKFEANGQTIQAPPDGCLLVKSGVLREVSIVVLGADAGTSVSISASQKEDCMTTETAPAVITTDSIREEAAAETERIAMIREACDGKHPKIEAQAIREGWDQNRIELAVLRANRPVGPPIYCEDGGVPTTAPFCAARSISRSVNSRATT